MFKTTKLILVFLSTLALCGCSMLEPKSGTRIVFELPNEGITREETADLSRYFIKQSSALLGADRARVDRVDKDELVLLLPGKSVNREDAEKLINIPNIELYKLGSVQTKNHPERHWRLIYPTLENPAYIFAGPNAIRINSEKEPQEVLKRVVGIPKTKPIITGVDIKPDSSAVGTTVRVLFTENGAKKIREFTRENVGEYMAVFSGGKLLSAAIIEAPIEEGMVVLTPFRTQNEAMQVASLIRSGSIPVQIKLKSVEKY